VSSARLTACAAFVALASTTVGAPLRAAPRPADPWTPERVLRFVLDLETQLQTLVELEFAGYEEKRNRASTGECHGAPALPLITASYALSRVRNFATGKALTCYVATYLGCQVGKWIVQSSAMQQIPPPSVPFKQSKVTIVEQTANRVVADVQEASVEDVHHDILGDWDDATSRVIPFTEEQLAKVSALSRYTFIRSADRGWRISDRKPPHPWECRPN
jgi:hypothetical protein